VHRIQHPAGHGDLHLVAELDDDAVGPRVEPPEDRYGFAVKWVVTIVDDG
jgi:hypothetical protein